jgi:putative DNA methylase
VPLARQTWLAKKNGRYIALRPDAESNRYKPPGEKTVLYRVAQATTEEGLGFDPAGGSQGGNVPCPFCSTVIDSSYIMVEGKADRINVQLIAIVCTQPNVNGKVYLAADETLTKFLSDDQYILQLQTLRALQADGSSQPVSQLTIPDEAIRRERPSPNARGLSAVTRYGFLHFEDLFTPRQLLSLLIFAKQVHAVNNSMLVHGYSVEHAKATTTYLGLLVDRLADYNSSFCSWHNTGEKVGHTFARQALPMVWDFVEINPLGNASGNAHSALNWVTDVIKSNSNLGPTAQVERSSATQMTFGSHSFDAIVTDPPYYDNVPYSDLSDFFYVWLRRSIGFLYPEHFSSSLTPKKREAIMDVGRHQGNIESAKQSYESLMAQTFVEASRVLKPEAPLVVVYAHKTTLGWATLIDALRLAGFTVTEAWPLDTEMSVRIRAIDTASLASSIFLVARQRKDNETGSYEREVQPELQRIVRERVERLWTQGVTGADLVIACVGAGLRAFTRYARVEYANGQEAPADSFLAEVEGAVLEGLLEKIFGVSRAGVSAVDAVTRFYVLWRYTYRQATLEAGEAIIFAYPQHVELDGSGGLTAGGNPLVEKKGSKYRLRDFAERGSDEDLGLPRPGLLRPAADTPLIDVLQRVLYLVENQPAAIPAYLDQARPDVERLRIVAQTLAGQTLAGNGEGGGKSLLAARGAEAAALRKLTTNWRTLIEAHRGGML